MMVAPSNYMFWPLTGHHQVVHSKKRVEGRTLYIVQPSTLFFECTT